MEGVRYHWQEFKEKHVYVIHCEVYILEKIISNII